jgi:uncharacterized protein
MQLSEDTPLTQFLVTAYEEGTVWVNHTPYTHSIILTPNAVYPWTEDLAELLQHEAELILIGTGNTGKIFTPEQLVIFYEKNLGVEVMNTQAACRTYNLLANEGRQVIAGLII